MSYPTVHFVSCVSKKRAVPSPARELYQSPWFRKARAYVEAQGGPWFILSAEHGLLRPEQVVGPYERTLNRMGVAARRAWAARVLEQWDGWGIGPVHAVFLAGVRYREFLVPGVETRRGTVEVPMEGLGIGRQLAWLKERSRRV